MEQKLRSDLISVADRFSEATGYSRGQISKYALADNTFFDRLDSGAGFTIRTYDRLVAWCHKNWPEGVRWPKEVAAPEPTKRKRRGK